MVSELSTVILDRTQTGRELDVKRDTIRRQDKARLDSVLYIYICISHGSQVLMSLLVCRSSSSS